MFKELASDTYTGFLLSVASAPSSLSCASNSLAVDTGARHDRGSDFEEDFDHILWEPITH